MKTWSFTTELDACLATDLLNAIYYLYQHTKKDIIPDVAEECSFNDICLKDEKSNITKTKSIWSKIYKALKKSPDIDLQYLINTVEDAQTKEKTIIILFKGSKEIEDWIINFSTQQTDFFESGVKAHLGYSKTIEFFESSFKSFCNEHLESVFSNIYNTKTDKSTKLILAGHSLGGALATLTACRFYDLGFSSKNIVVYSFGAPPIGTKNFIEKYENKFNIFRFVNTLDPVSKHEGPMNFFRKNDLFHLAKEISLFSNEAEMHSVKGYMDNLNEYINTNFPKDNK